MEGPAGCLLLKGNNKLQTDIGYTMNTANLTVNNSITIYQIKAPLYWLGGPVGIWSDFVIFSCRRRGDLQAACRLAKAPYLVKWVEVISEMAYSLRKPRGIPFRGE